MIRDGWENNEENSTAVDGVSFYESSFFPAMYATQDFIHGLRRPNARRVDERRGYEAYM